MFSETDLVNEVSGFIEASLQNGRVMRSQWLIHEIISNHPLVEFEQKDFYVLCAYGHIQKIVRDALRRYKPDLDKEPDPQITLPGFERLQKGYLVERDAESVLVPIEQMSDREIDLKVAEYERMAEGCRLHALELRRYKNQRGMVA